MKTPKRILDVELGWIEIPTGDADELEKLRINEDNKGKVDQVNLEDK